MDQYGRLLMAGGPSYRDADGTLVENMTKEELKKRVEALYPVMQAQWAQQIIRRNAAAQATRDRR